MIRDFCEQIRDSEFVCDAALAPYTTLRIGGPAEVLVYVKSEEELKDVLVAAHQNRLPIFLLGGGSNILIHDSGIKGVTLHLCGEMEKIEVMENGKAIWVGAAVSFPKLTKLALDLGIESALGWHGTPGLVGGALKMNAGGPLGEIGSVVDKVYGISLQGRKEFSKAEAGFVYRNSSFPKDTILTSAYLKCNDAKPEQATALHARSKELVTRRKQTQPKQRSAGSMFKNPKGDYAGRLIEACGLKGTRQGDAEISQVHANFIVNHKNATAADVYALSQLAQKRVFDETGILLEYEVKLIGF